MPPAPGLGGIVEMLDLLLFGLLLLGLGGFEIGAGTSGAGRIVMVAPPPGVRGGRRDGAEGNCQGESG